MSRSSALSKFFIWASIHSVAFMCRFLGYNLGYTLKYSEKPIPGSSADWQALWTVAMLWDFFFKNHSKLKNFPKRGVYPHTANPTPVNTPLPGISYIFWRKEQEASHRIQEQTVNFKKPKVYQIFICSKSHF